MARCACNSRSTGCAVVVRLSMAVSLSACDEASRLMRPEESAIVTWAMLERFGALWSLGGYISHLRPKAAQDDFSSKPTVAAVIRH